MASEVVDLFTDLAAISSPPGEERPVADAVTRYLRDLGLTVEEDDAGATVGSNMGNLYCRVAPSGNGGAPIFLCAHLDTTRRVLAEGRPHAGIELLFTPKEEVGLLGAAAFDHQRLHARLGYVYDQAAPIGDVILGAPYSQALEVSFHGRAAHSGMYPEEGRSAIAAAARAISDLRLGRIDEETTANVGLIQGGSAGNIIPEWCTLSAEARSHEERKLGDLVQEMVDAFAFAAGLEDCEVETKVSKSYRGYRFKRDDMVVRMAHEALERVGYTPSYGLSGGAADANVFNERGLACLNLANGMQDIHTADERITVDDLEGMVEVTLALFDVARDADA